MFLSRDTIAAVSTAPGRAAIAVIRLSGPQAGAALSALVGSLPEPRRASLRTFFDPRDGAALDRGLALWFPGPASATGEDMAELHLHGGRATVAATLDALLSVEGVRPAEPGEFTRRAFAAGRLDLAEAEGLADLLAAETDAQRRQALAQSGGALSRTVETWRSAIVEARALIEAGIDFSDEDGVPDEVRAAARPRIAALADALREAVADRRAERLREGFQVVILGRPNAGKSSLLNALARREVAIVTDAPGTTRDILEVHLDLDGLPVTVADTAGLRDAEDLAEREGVKRAERRAAAADLALWLDDGATPDDAPPPLGTAPVWRVRSKIDLAGRGAEAFGISVLTGEGVDELVTALAAEGRRALLAGEAGLTRARHRDAADAAAALLDDALARWDDLPDEILAELLRLAADELGRVTGRVGVEDVLGAIFSSFCVGK